MRMQRMNLAIERGFNHLLSQNIHDLEVRNRNTQKAHEIENALLSFKEKALAIKANPGLNAVGIKAELDILRGITNGQLAIMDNRPHLARKIQEADAVVINRTCQARGRSIKGELLRDLDPLEVLTVTLKTQEIRTFFNQSRLESKQAHADMLEKSKQTRTLLSDQERTWRDPLAQVYLEACRTFTEDKAVLIEAVEFPPYGVAMLNDNVLKAGNELLRMSVAPQQSEMIIALSAEAAAIDHLYEAATDILNSPESHEPVSEQYEPVSDQDRAND